jgi:hypothetical protein
MRSYGPKKRRREEKRRKRKNEKGPPRCCNIEPGQGYFQTLAIADF